MTGTLEILAWIGKRIGKPPGWERVVRIFASPEKCRGIGDICVIRDGVLFLAQPAITIGWHVVFFGSYEPESREIFRAVLPAGGVAVDVGANVGWHTLLMARLVGERGRVLAAEPNPSVRKRLEDHLKLNRLPQVDVIPFAIAEGEGTVEFYGPGAEDADSGNGYVVTSAAVGQRETVRVETRSLDAILAATEIQRLDLIKIDVEGYEWPVFRGAEKVITRFRPHIVFEFNMEYASRGGGTSQLLDDYFRRHRYKLYAIGRNWAEAIVPGRWPQCADIWAIPAS
jgi:FkbM family methyltransferase